MKTIPPPCPEPETGLRYWRSLDHLADTPEFRQWLEREFPDGASEFTDPVSRRHFVKLMSASFLLAGIGLTGCRRPEEKILPFARQPDNYVHGLPRYYATAMPSRGVAVPLVAKSHDGRPTKVEANVLVPDANLGTDAFTQASILDLYDPDRAQRFARGGQTVTAEAALDFLTSTSRKFAGTQGAGLCFLLESGASPSRARVLAEIQRRLPKARRFVYEPVDFEQGAAVASRLAGRPVRPHYRLAAARIILSLDCDFMGSEQDTARWIRDFAAGRRQGKPTDEMNRLYAVEGLMTLVGFNADHRLRVPTGAVPAVAAAVAARLLPNDPAAQALAGRFPLPAGVDAKWIEECAKDLQAHRGGSLVLAGHRQPAVVHALAALLNAALENVGKTLVFEELPAGADPGLSELAAALNAGEVDTLVIIGGNPVYNAPADLNWAATQRKAKTVVRLGYYEDETFQHCDWHLPAAHYLESWGDGRAADGTLVPIQPLIEPLFGGLTDLEVLARVGGLETLRPYDTVRATFQIESKAPAGEFENRWGKFLHDGFLAGSAVQPAASITLQAARAQEIFQAAAPAPAPSRDSLEVVFHRDYRLDDGRYNNNGWLQELPDPITKITWDNVILVSRKTADELDVRDGDVLQVELGGRRVEGPAWIQPGLADYSLGLALGYGRQMAVAGGTGRVGHQVGRYNAYHLRATAAPVASGAKATKTGAKQELATTQEHGSMEGRPIVREANLEDYRKHPRFAKNMDLEAHADHIPMDPKTGLPLKIYEHPYQAYEQRKRQVGVDLSQNVMKSDVHQWGMAIDLSTCVGCSACVVACQSENNIPIVGRDQVRRNREMHWMRIDRYYSGASEKGAGELIDDPQVVTQPMLCQHCEDAPCESVCPVNATVHDEEGLNVMAYNRCVGTRYCSNNCPYKVRRFNFFDYTRHPLDRLYKTPLATGHAGGWNLLNWFRETSRHHTVAEDQWDLLKLVRNPDVSVRMRGVMEKCTFCVQRIEQAKIAQKVKAGASGDVQVRDGAVQAACQQACPAGAIVFGNLLDPQSKVAQIKKSERDYSVLGFLDTRPRVTYLARVRNPNPAMPDYRKNPLNLQEYMDQEHANPFEEHHGDVTHAAGHGAAAGQQKGAQH